MYISSISNANGLPVSNPQFKSRGKVIPAMKSIVSPVSTTSANILRALFLSGVMMFGATSCDNNPPTKEIKTEELAKNSGITISPSQSVERKIEEVERKKEEVERKIEEVERKIEEVSTKKAEMKSSANEKQKRKRLNEAKEILIGFGMALGLYIVAFVLAWWAPPCDLDSPFEVSPPVRKRKKEWEPFYTKWLYNASDWFGSKFPDDTHYMDGL